MANRVVQSQVSTRIQLWRWMGSATRQVWGPVLRSKRVECNTFASRPVKVRFWIWIGIRFQLSRVEFTSCDTIYACVGAVVAYYTSTRNSSRTSTACYYQFAGSWKGSICRLLGDLANASDPILVAQHDRCVQIHSQTCQDFHLQIACR